jgi:hypothetical protein
MHAKNRRAREDHGFRMHTKFINAAMKLSDISRSVDSDIPEEFLANMRAFSLLVGEDLRAMRARVGASR